MQNLNNFNKNFQLINIDGIPPNPPANGKYKIKSNNIILSWDYIKEKDFNTFEIEKRYNDNSSLIYKTNSTYFIDNISYNLLCKNNNLIYKIYTIDLAGNKSDSIKIGPISNTEIIKKLYNIAKIQYLADNYTKSYQILSNLYKFVKKENLLILIIKNLEKLNNEQLFTYYLFDGLKHFPECKTLYFIGLLHYKNKNSILYNTIIQKISKKFPHSQEFEYYLK